MKHMVIHYHLRCEYVEDGTVKIEFIRLEENDADLFMNLPDNLFEKHAKKLVWKHEEVDVEVQQEGCQKMMWNPRVLSLTYLCFITTQQCSGNA